MVAFYILVIILKSPLYLAGYLLRHRALLVLCIVAAIGLFVISSYIKSQTSSATAEAVYQKTAPETPTVIVTPSRVYYVNSFDQGEEKITLTDFYEYNKEWERHTLPLSLPRDNIKIFERGEK